MSSDVTYTVEGAVGTIAFNRPESRNALTDPMINELAARFEQASKDMNVRCLILTGAGSAFCAGGSINDMRDRTGYAGGGPAHGWRSMIDQFQRIPRAFAELDVPIIAAVNGPAVGAGCDIAAMCDIRIAADTASFAESFIRLGVVSGDGGAWYLARAVGLSRAAEMTFTGDAVDAATAEKWGLVSRVVPAAELLASAAELARRIARNPPVALRLAKRYLRQAAETDLRTSLEIAAAMQGVALHTDDQREAVKAMMERRDGSFCGS